MTTALVEVRDLTKIFVSTHGLFSRVTRVCAVDHVSFDIARGETLALVGESGSGKTTLGRLVLRLLDPTAGSVRFDGTDIFSLARQPLRRLRRRMQIVFQDPYSSLNPRMTVGAAVAEPLEVHGMARGQERDQQVAALFQEVGLDPALTTHYPHELSGGQRQRVGIARALAVEPEFIALDEPVSSLDVSVQAQVLNLLLELRDRRGLTYLFIAHDLAVVRQLAQRVAVMYLGKLMEVAMAEPLYARPLHPYTTTLLSAIPVPDPDAQRERIVLAGDRPSAQKPPPGCVFHPRCPHPQKDARCRSEVPRLREVEPGRWAACHYAEAPLPSPVPVAHARGRPQSETA